MWPLDASNRASVRASKPAFSWPMPDDELNDIEGIHTFTNHIVTEVAVATEAVANAPLTKEAHECGDMALDEPEWRVGSTPPLLQITSPDPRTYLAALRREHRERQHRVLRIALAIAGGAAPLILMALLQIQATTARAVADDASVAMTVGPGFVSAPVGILTLVSAAQVTGYPPSHLVPTLGAPTDVGPARPPVRHKRRRSFRFDRVNAVVSRRKRLR